MHFRIRITRRGYRAEDTADADSRMFAFFAKYLK